MLYWVIGVAVVLAVAIRVTWPLAVGAGRRFSLSPIVIAIPVWALELALAWFFIKPS